jgi:hypothetical protein
VYGALRSVIPAGLMTDAHPNTATADSRVETAEPGVHRVRLVTCGALTAERAGQIAARAPDASVTGRPV